MQILQTTILSITRWGWFALLLSASFAYLISGISDPDESQKRTSKRIARSNRIAQVPKLSETLNQLNQLRFDELDALGMSSAPEADWMTICRRVSLALVGCGLSLEEIRELESVPESDREHVHLETLFNDQRFHHYWAQRFERQLVGVDEGPFLTFRRRRFREWLTETIAENWPYDRLVKSLVTADGLWTDKPEVNFLTATFDSNDDQPDPVRLAARTARVFLGLRIDCLQCHDDFLGNVSFAQGDDQTRSGEQADFHQLAAFFTAARSSGLQGVRNKDVHYEFQYLEADSPVSVPATVPYQKHLLGTEKSARANLADWIIHPENHQAAIAAVSHVWALMFGKPIADSVDDLPMDQPHPKCLDFLADDFVQHGFNLRRLIALIACSDAFRVDSRSDFEITGEHEDHYAVFPLVRLRPEQVAGSLIQSARIKRIDRQSSLLLQLQTIISGDEFVRRYGDVGEDEFTADAITITQRLLMMNGSMVADLIGENPVLNTTSHVAMFADNEANAIDAIYLSVLNRHPTETELDHFQTQIGSSTNHRKAIEDLTWTLINSSEFAWNH